MTIESTSDNMVIRILNNGDVEGYHGRCGAMEGTSNDLEIIIKCKLESSGKVTTEMEYVINRITGAATRTTVMSGERGPPARGVCSIVTRLL
jgi:hypothetical protein